METQTYRIGLLTLRAWRELVSPHGAIPLGGRALDLLSTLAEAGGALVTKDDLYAAVWASSIVEENAIQAQVSAARKALGEEARRLVTVHGRGYRLEIDSPVAAAHTAEADHASIAVLPFENTGNAEHAYLAHGLAEELISRLSRVSGLKVPARTSSFAYRGRAADVRTIAAELGVATVLEGSVRADGERLRVSVQLVDAGSGFNIWADSFDRRIGDLFALQDEIANAIAEALLVKLVSPAPRYVPNPRAFEFYLRARYLAADAHTQSGIVELCKSAVEIDPDFADAWALLSLHFAIAARWDDNVAPARELSASAREAAETAKRLQSHSGLADAALSLLEPLGNYSARERHICRGLEADSANSETYRQYYFLLYSLGRMRDATAAAEHAWLLDPLHPQSANLHAGLLFEQGMVCAAQDAYALGRARWPEVWWFQLHPVTLAAFSGDWAMVDEILSETANKASQQLSSVAFTLDALRYPSAEKNQMALAVAEHSLAEKGGVEPSTLLFLHAVGLRDEAFALIGRSEYPHIFDPYGRFVDNVGYSSGIIFLRFAREMRLDARFIELCHKLGLCAYWLDTGNWPDCADDPDLPYDFRHAVRCAVGR